MLDHFFYCPYCNEQILMMLDPWAGRQIYIEDCEVCCNPIEIQFRFEEGELIEFLANSIEQ